MSQALIGPYLEYIGLTAPELEILRALRAEVDNSAPAFLKMFYDHLLAFPATRAFLNDDATVRRLLQAQHQYLLMLFDAQFDDEYYHQRCQIGIRHFKIGLDFQWYIGAYVLYLDFSKTLARNLFCTHEAQEQLAQRAIRKAVLLDMSIVLEAYHQEDRNALKISQAHVLHQEKLSTIGLLSAGLAHEIGNPLASVQLICDNQLRKNLDPDVAQKFSRIKDQIQRVTKIVQQLVSFSRPTGEMFEPTELEQVIEPALTMAKLSRASKDVEITMEIAIGLTVPAIRDQLAQVFLNLFLNAFDAMQERTGRLRVSARIADQCAIIEVEDNGAGMEAAQLARLFKPFTSTKAQGKGTGLGLFVSLGIIERHGGTIEVTSTPCIGTKFQIRLPLKSSLRS